MNFPRIKKALMVTPHIYSYGGLLIAGIMESAGVNVEVTRNISDIPIFGRKVDIVCLSLQSTTHLFEVKKYLKRLKNKDPTKLVIAGGPAVQDPFFASCILENIDAFTLGEGDETIIDILKIRNKSELENLEGLAVMNESGSVTLTSPRTLPELSGRPFPKVPIDLKKQNVRGVNIYIETHRGCVGRCIFCQYCRLFGHKIRSRPLPDILNEIKYFKEFGIKKIAFSAGDMSLYGIDLKESKIENFTALYKNASKIIGSKNIAGPDIRPDRVLPEILKSVREFTQGWIFLGIESGCQRILDFVKKDLKVEDIYAAVNLAKRYKVKVLGSFMIGFVNETQYDFLETQKLIKDLPLDNCSINIAEPIPATPYWEVVKKTSLKANPLFIPSENEKKLSVAEERVLTLYKTFYQKIYGKKIPQNIIKCKSFQVMKEADRIRKIILKMKKVSSNSRI